MKLVFLGAPGAGKGTQAKKLCHFLNIPQISTGDILREAVLEKTDLGLKAEAYMAQGALVPDELIIKIVEKRVKEPDCRDGYILDGFPRSLAQAEALDQSMSKKNESIDVVIFLDVPEDELIARLLERNRDDDSIEVVTERIKVYKNETEPLVEYFQSRNLLKRITGIGTVDEIFEKILFALESRKDSFKAQTA